MVRAESLTDQAYTSLRDAIASGDFVPGQKITTRGLGGALGISATPAREALNRLVTEHVLEFGPNRTVFVPVLTRARVREIYEIRLALEGLAAELAGAELTKSDAVQLAACQDALILAREQGEFKKVMSLNRNFHFSIYQASGRAMLVEMIENLWLIMGPTMNLLYPEFADARANTKNHARAIEAVSAGSAKDLRAAMLSDLIEGRDHLLAGDKLDSD